MRSRNGEAERSRRVHARPGESRGNRRGRAGHDAQTEADEEGAELAAEQYLLPRIQTGADRQQPGQGCEKLNSSKANDGG